MRTWSLFPIALLIGAQACQQSHADHTTTEANLVEERAALPAGTVEMVAMLKEIRAKQKADPNDGFMNSSRADSFAKLAAASADVGQRSALRIRQSNELIRAGRTNEAIPIIEELVEQMEVGAFIAQPGDQLRIYQLLGLAHLRIGEQTNCQQNHTNESCIIPISEKGRHIDQRGSRRAIEVYTRILQRFPEDLSSRWLLNVAYMTIGEHPQKVPGQWLIPASALGPDSGFPRFPDVAMEVGLDMGMNGLSGGACMEDFNGDGLLDVLASSWSLDDNVQLFINTGKGDFVERTHEAGLTGITGGLNLIHADYDNDGDVDALVLRGAWRSDAPQPNSLLRNNGDGTFEDVTKAAGMLTLHHTQTGSWGDYDNDGDLDLFVGNESEKAPAPQLPCELFRNNGDGTFTNVAQDAGVAAVAFIKGSVWGDVDNDGYLDLYVSTLSGSNMLFMNQGPDASGRFSFRDMAASAGVVDPQFSFPAWMFDYNNDGWLDIFVSGYDMRQLTRFGASVAAGYLGMPIPAERSTLYRNDRDGTFTMVTEEAGLGRAMFSMGCNFGDLDNDGWLDFYLATGEPELGSIIPNLMFRNTGDGRFEDVTVAGGFGNLQKGHGVAFGDIDNDGDQDIYVTMGGAYEGDGYQNLLFKNPGTGNHWVTLMLEGTKSARCAIGARIKVTVETPKGPRDIYATVGTGGSFGASSLRQEIGLGNASRIIQVEVTWPATNEKQVFTEVPMDRMVKLVEGGSDIIVRDIPKVELHGAQGSSDHMHHHMN